MMEEFVNDNLWQCHISLLLKKQPDSPSILPYSSTFLSGD